MSETSSEYLRSGELLSRQNSRLLIVDVQEKLLTHIPVAEQLVDNCRRLIEAAKILGIPVDGTVHYPRGLGAMTEQLAELLGPLPEKLRFSAVEVLDWPAAAARDDDRDQVVVAGIETHVCIQQTVLDLLSQGYRVYVPADAVASRRKLDWKMALERMANCGATLTTAESVLFEWCEVGDTPEFKQVLDLIRPG